MSSNKSFLERVTDTVKEAMNYLDEEERPPQQLQHVILGKNTVLDLTGVKNLKVRIVPSR